MMYFCLSEYLGFPDTGNKACDYIRPKLKSGYFRNAPRWIISSDSKGDVSITAIRPCAKRGLTSSSTTSSRTRVYLSKPGNRWTLIPVSGSCDHVYIQSTVCVDAPGQVQSSNPWTALVST